MRVMTAATAALFLLPGLASAQLGSEDKHDHHKFKGGTVSANDPPIQITINPEARVSVALAGTLPPPGQCGVAADLMVSIINQGFVTAQLEAEFVGDPPRGVALDFHPRPLKGVTEELRTLHITLAEPGPTDLTIVFRAKNGIPDLGGRDRIHFLIRCI